ncbi:putative peptidase [Podospora aff. communis PSN243]|uniref:Xaa-Pro aminopeptidase n=1 Tax=Podospora aff. communis PSN243 TaxID=3040156 RepID=A0AAV9H1S8_9PEZI|nr:putative peptidase [Podospora aff. communis PSN243]
MSFPRVALRRLESHVARPPRPFASLPARIQLRPVFTRLPLPCHSRLRGAPRGYSTVSAAELEFGQPVYETHPHILQPGEITPGITAQEYANRRADLAYSLPENGVAILPAAVLQYRSGPVFYPFRQESNLLYLTGFLEPDSVAVIRRTGPDHGDYVFYLFCRPKDPKAEQWSGPWSGLQAATDVFNADESHDIASLTTILPSLLRSATAVYADLPTSSPHTQPIRSALPSSTPPHSLRLLLNPIRAVKSPAEIAVMRHAGRISGRALTSAMRRPWTLEKDLYTFLAHEFSQHGLDGPAYVPVIAGGSRGLMIHYVHNNRALTPGSTVLVDAGGEYGNYITDITRSWPVSGRFSPAQRDLYSAVLTVQRQCVSLCRANAGLSLDAIHRASEDGLRRELKALGFDIGSGGRTLDMLYPHHVGHYVGLDVHDVPGYGRSITLKKGHCVTVEPGVYVPDDERWPKHFRGLAVRIEDSIAVDDEGPVVLTVEAVKEVVDIEALREDV